MKATFETRPSPRPRHTDKETGVTKPVEYVTLTTGAPGADTVHREATDADRVAFRAEYFAFNPQAGELPLFRSTSHEAEEAKRGLFSRKK